MDTLGPIPFPRAFEPTADELERALAEIDVAIELVARGDAVRISLSGFAMGGVVAALGSAHAQAASVQFRLERNGVESPHAIVIGPTLTVPTIRASH